MCEPTTIIAGLSLAASAAGGAMQYNASKKQAKALEFQENAETGRQQRIMREQHRLQEIQRQDALEARKKFNDETLPAFTREKMEGDAAQAQTGIAAALKAAGERAGAVPANVADATQSTGAVSVSQEPVAAASSSESASYRGAFRQALERAARTNEQQSNAQGALLALGRAQQLGGERLQTAGNSIMLSNARLNALNRPRQALGLMGDASSRMYGSLVQDAADTGAEQALAGSIATTLGNIGYSYASRGPRSQQQTPPKAIPIT